LDFLRDPVSSASHFLAAALAFVATLFLVRFAGRDRTRRITVLVFGTCMTFLYASSGLYHALRLSPDELRVYQRLDMSAIYLMIAGSCTPMMAILLRGRFRTILLAGQWAFAAFGIAALWLLPKPDHAVLVGTYLGLGWLGPAGIWHYWRATGWRGISWAMAGAAFYTVGAVIELARWPTLVPGVVRSHELLHFCDIVGTGCHVVFIFRYVLPNQPMEVAPTREAARFVVAETRP
jgi:channel protein (hemolysin III family)